MPALYRRGPRSSSLPRGYYTACAHKLQTEFSSSRNIMQFPRREDRHQQGRRCRHPAASLLECAQKTSRSAPSRTDRDPVRKSIANFEALR